jgi:hypothetical protein
MADIFKATDSELVAQASTLVGVASSNASILQLTPADIVTMTGLSTAYGTSYSTMVTARDAARASTQTKDTAKAALIANFRAFARRAYANPNVSDALIAQLGLPVHDTTRTPINPVAPINLVANSFANGEVKLRWKRGGNPRNGIVFWVEASFDLANWSVVGTSTRASFALQDQTPGLTRYFRVRATATDKISAPSNEAVIYPSESGSALSVVDGGQAAA